MRISERLNRKTILSGVARATLLVIMGFIISSAQQSGTITGRVVNDEGDGVQNVNIHFAPVPTGQRVGFTRRSTMVVTDKDGNFRANGLSPGLYTLTVAHAREYFMKPLAAAVRREQRYYRVGDNITFTLV